MCPKNAGDLAVRDYNLKSLPYRRFKCKLEYLRNERVAKLTKSPADKKINACRFSIENQASLEVFSELIAAGEQLDDRYLDEFKVLQSPSWQESQVGLTSSCERFKAQSLLPTPRLGMSDRQVREKTSWGEPNRVNRTVTAGGVSEQWVYPGSYLYFRNGRVTAIQSSD